MGSERRRPKPVESALSVLILVILAFIACGLFLIQGRFDIVRFAVEAEVAAVAEDREKTELSLAVFAPSGFEKLSDAESYTAENLYEKINGKAPMYTESGFAKLATARFVSKANADLWMEVYLYDMGEAINAFSVFSIQRRAEAQYLSRPNTYKTTNGVFFAAGRFYGELIGSVQSEELVNAMIETADKMRAGFEIEQAPIPETDLLSAENIVAGSIKLYLSNAFGFEGLDKTFTAQYRVGGETITGFLSSRSSVGTAAAVAESYRKFLLENGAAVKDVMNKNLSGGVFDFYGTTEIVLTAGSYVIGVHEAENQQQAEKLAGQLLGQISRQTQVDAK